MSARAQETPLSLDVGRLTGTLVRIAVLLGLLSTLGQVLRFVHGREHALGFVRLFYMDNEANVPTFFATALLMLAAGSLWVVGAVGRRAAHAGARYWSVLGVIFLYLAVDEAAQLHEMTIEPVRGWIGASQGILYFAWVVPGGLLALIVGLAYLPFLRSLPRATTRGLVLAGVLYVGGALGLELVEGAMLRADGGPSLALSMAVTLEETLELLGVVLLIHTTLRYLEQQRASLVLAFSRPAG